MLSLDMSAVNSGGDEKLFLAATKRRELFPDPDSLLDVAFQLATVARSSAFHITLTVVSGASRAFSQNNFYELPVFLMENYDAAHTGCSLIVRRVEDGPVEPISRRPYKTLAGAFFFHGKWLLIDEEQMKDAHVTNFATGMHLPVEDGVLFSSLSEMLPEVFPDTAA